jgi:hypothetical protein
MVRLEAAHMNKWQTSQEESLRRKMHQEEVSDKMRAEMEESWLRKECHCLANAMNMVGKILTDIERKHPKHYAQIRLKMYDTFGLTEADLDRCLQQWARKEPNR